MGCLCHFAIFFIKALNYPPPKKRKTINGKTVQTYLSVAWAVAPLCPQARLPPHASPHQAVGLCVFWSKRTFDQYISFV